MRSILHIKRIFPLVLLLAFVNLFCRGALSPEETPPAAPREDSWTIHTPFKWAHDGRPIDGTFVTVYSDGAGDALKQQICEIADQHFMDIMQLFDFDQIGDLRYPPGYPRIDVYINRFHTENIAWAYWGGFLITIRVEPLNARWLGYVTYTGHHEMVHVFEFLIEGKGGLSTDVWFREGLAVHLSDTEAVGFDLVDTISELDAWIARNAHHPDQGNPVAIHSHTDYPPDADRTYYYFVFELAIRYLLDSRGGARSLQDVLGVFYDMRHNIPFPVSFAERMGIGLDRFEQEFYDRMVDYLCLP